MDIQTEQMFFGEYVVCQNVIWKKTGAGNTSLEFWRGKISSGDFVGTAKRTLRTPWQNQLKDIIEVTQSTHTPSWCVKVEFGWIWPFRSICSGYFMAREEPPRIQLVSPNTLPKFNSSPLKSYRAPIGKANVFQTPFVQGRADKLWRKYSSYSSRTT